MNNLHHALIVEDEPEAAADLEDILKDCGCECVIATNRRDALTQLETGGFCIILLDLQIKSEPDSIRGRLENGKQFLKEARARYPDRSGPRYALPIVVLSGLAAETEPAVAVMRDGASDVIQKMSTAQHKSDRIHEALETSGRTSHRVCEGLVRASTTELASSGLILSIPGEQEGRRVVVRLGQRPAKLTHTALKILLHLVKARLSNSLVHKTDLGARSDRGFRGVSVLRQELARAYDGNASELVTNDQRGSYGLGKEVTLGDVDTRKLELLGDRQITELAREIRRISKGMKDPSEKTESFRHTSDDRFAVFHSYVTSVAAAVRGLSSNSNDRNRQWQRLARNARARARTTASARSTSTRTRHASP